VKRTHGAIDPDVAALIKRSKDLQDEAEELNRTAEELAKKAARLRGGLGETEAASNDERVADVNRIISPGVSGGE
jgi:predicted  nucleic acid-binding Zn-ribbon protein